VADSAFFCGKVSCPPMNVHWQNVYNGKKSWIKKYYCSADRTYDYLNLTVVVLMCNRIFRHL